MSVGSDQGAVTLICSAVPDPLPIKTIVQLQYAVCDNNVELQLVCSVFSACLTIRREMPVILCPGFVVVIDNIDDPFFFGMGPRALLSVFQPSL